MKSAGENADKALLAQQSVSGNQSVWPKKKIKAKWCCLEAGSSQAAPILANPTPKQEDVTGLNWEASFGSPGAKWDLAFYPNLTLGFAVPKPALTRLLPKASGAGSALVAEPCSSRDLLGTGWKK